MYSSTRTRGGSTPLLRCTCPFANFKKYQALLRDTGLETTQALGTGQQARSVLLRSLGLRSHVPPPAVGVLGESTSFSLTCLFQDVRVHRRMSTERTSWTTLSTVQKIALGLGIPASAAVAYILYRRYRESRGTWPPRLRPRPGAVAACQARCPLLGRNWLSLRGL